MKKSSNVKKVLSKLNMLIILKLSMLLKLIVIQAEYKKKTNYLKKKLEVRKQ